MYEHNKEVEPISDREQDDTLVLLFLGFRVKVEDFTGNPECTFATFSPFVTSCSPSSSSSTAGGGVKLIFTRGQIINTVPLEGL